MQTQPMIRQGWLRVLIFLIGFVAVLILITRFVLPWLPTPGSSSPTQETEETGTAQFSLFVTLTITSLASYLLVLIFRRFVDGQTVNSLGFQLKGYTAHAAAGFLLGLVLIGIGTLALILTKNFEWIDMQADPSQLFLTMGLMVIIAVGEELAFRGYILGNLMDSMNKWIALVLSAFIFSLFHSNNPAIDVIPLVNLFLGGLLLGINYIYTRNLWFGILFHFTWNFYQGGMLGYDVSGLRLHSLLLHERTGEGWLTGGNFGFEGSVICTVLCIIATVLLAWIYEKKTRPALK
jgi:uncharacterized protein